MTMSGSFNKTEYTVSAEKEYKTLGFVMTKKLTSKLWQPHTFVYLFSLLESSMNGFLCLLIGYYKQTH